MIKCYSLLRRERPCGFVNGSVEDSPFRWIGWEGVAETNLWVGPRGKQGTNPQAGTERGSGIRGQWGLGEAVTLKGERGTEILGEKEEEATPALPLPAHLYSNKGPGVCSRSTHISQALFKQLIAPHLIPIN